jgi:hypothetical protein
MNEKTETLPETVTARDLARLLALSDRSVRRLASEGVIPAAADGKFNLVKAVSSYVKSIKAKTDAPTLLAARRRRMEAQAGLSELDLETRKKNLVSLDEMDQRLRPMLVGVRQRILGSTLSDDEKDELLEGLGEQLEHALMRNLNETKTR